MPILEAGILGASGALAAKSVAAAHSAGWWSSGSLMKVFSGSFLHIHGAHAASAAAVADGAAGGAQLLSAAARAGCFNRGASEGGAQVASLSVHAVSSSLGHSASHSALSHGAPAAAAAKTRLLGKFSSKTTTTASRTAAPSKASTTAASRGLANPTPATASKGASLTKPASRLQRFHPSSSQSTAPQPSSSPLLPEPGTRSVTVTRDVAEPTNQGILHHITKTVTESTDALEPASAAVTVSAAMFPILCNGVQQGFPSLNHEPLKSSEDAASGLEGQGDSPLNSERRRVSLCGKKDRMLLYSAFL